MHAINIIMNLNLLAIQWSMNNVAPLHSSHNTLNYFNPKDMLLMASRRSDTSMSRFPFPILVLAVDSIENVP